MKKCPYCGKRYSDETNECPYDGESLQPIVAQPPPIPPEARRPRGGALPPAVRSSTRQPVPGAPVPPRQKSSDMNGVAIAVLVAAGLFLVGIPFMAGLLLPALAKAKAKAVRIQCASNMKQVGLAVRIWSSEHGGQLPKSFADLGNQLVKPAILHCPGDFRNSSQQSPVMTATNVTYEFLLPGTSEDQVAKQAIIRCPIHGTELWGDGSVHIGKLR